MPARQWHGLGRRDPDLWLDERQPVEEIREVGWWKGCHVEVGSETIQVDTIYDVLDKMSTVAFMDGNGVVMLGKVVSCERKKGNDKGGTKNRVCRALLAPWPT